VLAADARRHGHPTEVEELERLGVDPVDRNMFQTAIAAFDAAVVGAKDARDALGQCDVSPGAETTCRRPSSGGKALDLHGRGHVPGASARTRGPAPWGPFQIVVTGALVVVHAPYRATYGVGEEIDAHQEQTEMSRSMWQNGTRTRLARAASHPGPQHVELAAWRGRVEAVLDQPTDRQQASQRPPRADHVEVDVGARLITVDLQEHVTDAQSRASRWATTTSTPFTSAIVAADAKLTRR
jgi:hypothetical protein